MRRALASRRAARIHRAPCGAAKPSLKPPPKPHPTNPLSGKRSYFLDNTAGWILELDRGAGIPFEGNYSEWLGAKNKRLSVEEKQQSSLRKTIEREVEWASRQAKGQQKKGQARMRRCVGGRCSLLAARRSLPLSPPS